MMSREQILMGFDDLLALAREIEGRPIGRAHGGGAIFSEKDYILFRTRAMNLVGRVCGKDGDHYQELHRIATTKETARSTYHLPECVAAVEAARQDFERGLLLDMRALISAELLADFLEQAAHLLDAGYKDPAASLAGAVLEDTLRKLCDKMGISYPGRTKIDSLNVELAKAGAYNSLVQKQITAWADLRNKADHGKFKDYDHGQVKAMIEGVRKLAADHLK